MKAPPAWLNAFGKHALSVLGEALAKKGMVAAVGHIHQDDPEVLDRHAHYPKSVGHYWNGYAVEISRKDPNPRFFAQYVRVAQGLVADGSVLSRGVEKIASGTLELARRLGDIGELNRKARTHRVVVEALGNDAAALAAYQNFLRLFLVKRTVLSIDEWPSHREKISSVAAALCTGEIDDSKAEEFLAWPQGDPSLDTSATCSSGDARLNIIRVSDDSGSIDIRLGSIHSVKGQTHLATLLLSTYWHDHSAKQMMPWLLGQKANGLGAGKRDIQRLLHTYVAMTRPSHLLCLAVPRSAFGDDHAINQTFSKLRRAGWHVAEIVDETAQWRD